MSMALVLKKVDKEMLWDHTALKIQSVHRVKVVGILKFAWVVNVRYL